MSLTTASKPAIYDFHLHTGWSYDATADIELYFRKARELDVRYIAITEHHNIDSAKENLLVAEKYPEVRLIIAAELSVTTSIGSVDLLCYNLPLNPTGSFAEILAEYHTWQRESGAAKSRALQALGYPYTDKARIELLESYRPARALAVQGATHVANRIETAYFIEKGYIASREELQEKLRQTNVASPPYPRVKPVVDAVKEAGGVVAIAHPARYFLNDDIARMDALRRECDLDGIECAHPTVAAELTDFYRAYCKKHGLFSTGGSDSHHNEHIENATLPWEKNEEKRFAGHLGEEAWLEEFLERLA